MGDFNGTVRYDEPGDDEVLRFEPSWRENGVIMQSIALCPIENSELSIIINKRWENKEDDFCHFILIEEEVDMMVDALLNVKNIWNKERKSDDPIYNGVFSKEFINRIS